MKKLAMVLALAFTMGLAASTANAITKDVKKKEKTATCAKASECCSKDKKACCASAKTAETPAPAKK